MDEETCRVCNGTSFEEVEGEFYCTICSTQLIGFVAEKTDEQDLLGLRLKSAEAKRKRKSRGLIDTGINWTSYEAFNLILVDHLRVLTTDCGLHDDLRKVVLTIWATFLEKTQVGFIDDSTTDPKLSAKIRRRDVAILSRKVSKIPQPKYKDSSCRDGQSKKRIRYGNFVVIKKSSQELDDYGVDENKRSIEANKKYFKSVDAIDEEIKRTMFNNPKSADIIIDTSSSDSDDDGVKVMKKTESVEVFDLDQNEDEEEYLTSQDEDEEYFYFNTKVPFSQLNNFSKLMTKSMGSHYNRRNSYPGSKQLVDYMDMLKLISFIYLGIRLLNLNDVHMSVLLKWIDQGVLPFNKGVNGLPKDWIKVSNDITTFGMYNKSLSIKNILITSSLLHSFLKLPELPEVNMVKLIADQMHHLNLPRDLINLMVTDERFTNYLRKAARKRQTDTFIRRYELTSFAVLFVLLRKLFGLIGQAPTGSTNCNEDFNWNKWESHSRLKLFMITNHIIPTFQQNFDNFNDSTEFIKFYEMTIKEWRHRDIAHIKWDSWIDDQVYIELSGIIKKMIDTDLLNNETKDGLKTESKTRKPSKYFLIESVDKLNERIQSEEVKLILNHDFRSKSVDYFKSGSMYINEYSDLVIGKVRKGGKFKRSPSIDVLILLGMITFRFDVEQLRHEVGQVERVIFHKHNPSTRLTAPIYTKRRKRNWI